MTRHTIFSSHMADILGHGCAFRCSHPSIRWPLYRLPLQRHQLPMAMRSKTCTPHGFRSTSIRSCSSSQLASRRRSVLSTNGTLMLLTLAPQPLLICGFIWLLRSPKHAGFRVSEIVAGGAPARLTSSLAAYPGTPRRWTRLHLPLPASLRFQLDQADVAGP